MDSLDPLPTFSEVYVISDLHLGGPPGFQMFPGDHAGLLENFIDQHLLDKQHDGAKVALVINGDLVDLLAEVDFRDKNRERLCFDPKGAREKVERILKGEPAFAGVLRGLRKFVQTANRYLVIILGNHDLELALPWIQELLLRELSGEHEAARGRITLRFDGTGFRCRVGRKDSVLANVLCVHGNEVDPWNGVNYGSLLARGQDYLERQQVKAWVPNQGTSFVVKVMNDIKAEFPFVDLLKPERPAVARALLALQPFLILKAPSLAGSFFGRLYSWAREKAGFLRERESPSRAAPPAGTAETGAAAEEEPQAIDSARLLALTEERLRNGVDPFDLVGDGEFLWEWSDLKQWVPEFRRPKSAAEFIYGDPSEALRESLAGLERDQSFDLYERDDTFRALDERVGEDVDFLIAGHTHLERARPRTIRGYYFNSGTWARVIRLQPEVLRNEEKFRQVYDALAQRTLEALEDRQLGLVERRPAVVKVAFNHGKVHGTILRVAWKDGQAEVWHGDHKVPGTVTIDKVPNSAEFVRG
jgi:UDP-2,3-diacylglucosamine pyrophosphatase LpxH